MYNLLGSVNPTSYGICTLNFLRNTQAAFFPIGPIQAEEKDHQLIKDSIKRAEKPDFDAPSVRIWHEFNLSEHVSRKLRVGFPIFEKNRFTDNEQHHIKNQDALFVCSKWAKSITEGLVPTYVVPLGVNLSEFHPKPYVQQSDKTIFLNIGKFEKRKGHEFLHEVFYDAFPKENVELWMSWNTLTHREELYKWEQTYKAKLGHRVKFFPWLSSVSELIEQADVGIFPSLAEGWCLPALECLASGKHVIATNYSGLTEFCTKENSKLVDIEEFELAQDGFWFHGTFDWAKYGKNQKEQLVEHMRSIHRAKVSGNLTQNIAGIKTGETYTWLNSSKILEGLLKQLA